MDKLNNKQKAMGLGLVAAGAALLWYLLTREDKKDSDDDEYQVNPKKDIDTVDDHKIVPGRKKDENVDVDQFVDQFKLQYVEGTDIINLSTLQQIMNISVKMSIQEYSEYTVQNRRDRRQKKNEGDNESYFHLLNEYCDELQNILIKNQTRFTDKVGILEAQLEQSMNYYLEKGFMQQIYMMGANQSVQLKDSIKSNKTLEQEQILEIFRFQVDWFNQPSTADVLRGMKDRLKDSSVQSDMDVLQKFPTLINICMADEVAQVFNYEEEDIIKFLREPRNINEKIQQVMVQLEQVMQQTISQHLMPR